MKTPEEMAEEYVDQFNFWGEHRHFVKRGFKDAYLAGYQAAKDQLADADKVMPQWISVKDRLPEINQQFIAFVENKEVCNCSRYQNRSSDNSPSFYASTKTGLLICGLESISHWMPLPEPPKEEK